MRNQLFILIAVSTIAFATDANRQMFVQVGPCLAIATLEGGSDLKKSPWASAASIWVPDLDRVNEGLELLKMPDGRQ